MSDAFAHLTKRRPAQWAVRIALAAVAVGAAYISVSDTMANVVVKRDPVRAHALAPWDGKVTGQLAEHSLEMSLANQSKSDAARIAREAIMQDATAVEAFTVLALEAQTKGDAAKVNALFEQSRRLSRRELQAHIWAIEEAVNRGDIDTALGRYDTALRTSSRATEVLFPILAAALAEPKIRSRVVKMVAAEPMWGESFVTFTGLGNFEPQAAASFFAGLDNARYEVEDVHRTALVNALSTAEGFDAAWNYYATFRTDASRTQSRDPSFSALVQQPSIFDWRTFDSTGVFATIQRAGEGGLVEFSASPGSGGRVLAQSQMLLPGTYELVARVSDLDGVESAKPYWTLTCADGRELGRVEMDNQQGEQVVRGSFTVDSGCVNQALALVVRPSDAISGVFGRVSSAELARQ